MTALACARRAADRTPTTCRDICGVTAARADADDLATAQANCDVAIEAAVRWNSALALAAAHSLRTSVARRRGDLAAAEQDGRTAAGLLAAAGVDPLADAAVLLLARRIAIRLDRGDVAGAEELLDAVDDLPDGGGSLALRYSRGRLYAATGRPGEGLADLFFCGERLAARQADRPERAALAVVGRGDPGRDRHRGGGRPAGRRRGASWPGGPVRPPRSAGRCAIEGVVPAAAGWPPCTRRSGC